MRQPLIAPSRAGRAAPAGRGGPGKAGPLLAAQSGRTAGRAPRQPGGHLIGLGHTVLVGTRDPQRGAQAVAALGARFVPIVVSDDVPVAAAAVDVADHEDVIDV
ncbi:hypothetical protein [Streptomyces broussonetiae]|uniref:hypothetical protein n=1 Tax=Streptomyces broussonetiae TaxID=2686304 RepID=UPI0035E23419